VKNPTFPTLAPFDPADFLLVLKSRGIALSAFGGRIRFDAPLGAFTPELRTVAVEHRGELLQALPPQDAVPSGVATGDGPQDAHASPTGGVDLRPQDSDAADWIKYTTANGRQGWQRSDLDGCEIIDPPAPCPDCGGIVFWWDVAGGQHCERCQPPRHGPRLRELAQRLRERHAAENRPHGLPQDARNGATMTCDPSGGPMPQASVYATPAQAADSGENRRAVPTGEKIESA
jgi:hypothetical protein